MTLNLVVRPDGTAELDDRPAPDVAKAVFGRAWMTVNLRVDGEVVGRALCLPSEAGDENDLARLMVVELTEAHFRFAGPVVLADLTAGTAHLLLEIVKND